MKSPSRYQIMTNEFERLDQKTYIKYHLGVLPNLNLKRKYHIFIVQYVKNQQNHPCYCKTKTFCLFSHAVNALQIFDFPISDLFNQIPVLEKHALHLIQFAPHRSPAIPLSVSSCCLSISLLYFKSVSAVMHDVFNNLLPWPQLFKGWIALTIR